MILFCKYMGHKYDNGEFPQCPQCKKNYKKQNQFRMNYHSANTVAGKNRPRWLSKDQKSYILDFYRLAGLLSKEFKIQMDVDHVVPLHGKNVSGLHVPWNLQIMAHTANVRKNRRFNCEL